MSLGLHRLFRRQIDLNDLPVCNQPWNTLYVQWDGRITQPCCHGPHSLGDLNELGWEKVWNGKAFQMLRRQIASKTPKGTCVECLEGRRHFADYVGPFTQVLLPESKKQNFERARMHCAKRDTILQSKPYVLILDIGSKCNLRCRKCFIYGQERLPELGFMSMETFQGISPIFPDAIKVLCTGVGESTLNPDFEIMVKMLTEHGCWISFTTTGNPLDVALCKRLVGYKVDEIIFSIDSIDPETYGYHHRGGSLEKVMDNIRTIHETKEVFKSYQPHLTWVLVGMKSNLEELNAAVQVAASMGFRSFFVEQLQPALQGHRKEYWDFYSKQNVIESPEDIRFAAACLGGGRKSAKDAGIIFASSYDSVLKLP